MQENIVYIPGLMSGEKEYRELLKKISKNYNVFIFEANYKKSLQEVCIDLLNFIEKNNIKKTNFVTHSFGSVVLKYFYNDYEKFFLKTVEIAPLNNGCRVLKKTDQILGKILTFFAGKAYKDLLKNHKKFLKLKNPKNLAVIAGNKRFNPLHIEYYFLPLIIDNDNSDGKVFIEETKTQNMQDFYLLNDDHTHILKNHKTPQLIVSFLQNNNFSV